MTKTTEPPSLKSYSAAEFRQWLAGLTEDRDERDYEELKPLLFEFIGILPLIYQLPDRLVMWSRIAEHIVQAADSCGDDVSVFLDDLRERLGGDVSRMTTDEVATVLAPIYQLPKADQVLAMRIVRECPSELVICGKNLWTQRNEDKKGGAS